MIGQDVAAALPELRAQAESLMSSTCDIDRAVSVWSEEDQQTVTGWVSVHAGIPCRFLEPPVTTRSLVADQAATNVAPRVKVPVRYDGIEPDDRVTVNGSVVVWVTHAPSYDDQVQRRIECRWVR